MSSDLQRVFPVATDVVYKENRVMRIHKFYNT